MKNESDGMVKTLLPKNKKVNFWISKTRMCPTAGGPDTKSLIYAFGMSYNVSGARRLVKRDSVEPNVSEQNARMSAFWRRPRSDSDEALHRVLCDVIYATEPCAMEGTRAFWIS